MKQYWVAFVTIVTIAFWCVEHEIEDYVGDMGVIALFPIVAFFSTGVLKKVGPVQLLITVCSSGLPRAITLCSFRTTLRNSHGRLCSWLWEESP